MSQLTQDRFVFTLNISVAQSQWPSENLARLGDKIITKISLYLGKLEKPKRSVHSLILFKPWTGYVDTQKVMGITCSQVTEILEPKNTPSDI